MSEASFSTRATGQVDSGGFVVGFPARRDAAAMALADSHATRPSGFTPAELIARIEEAFGGGPKHFSPAAPDAKATAGWDPMDADAEPTPFIDPVETAREAGYAEGVAAARAEMDATAARDRAMLTGLAAALGQAGGFDRDLLAGRLRATVMTLVSRVIGEAGVSADLLARRVEAATDLLADASESAMLRVHPDDVALLDGHLPATVFAVGDEQVARGSFVLEAASTIVEDGPAMWLDQLTAAIDRVALPA
jgi:flagellar assembly protein FliH